MENRRACYKWVPEQDQDYGGLAANKTIGYHNLKSEYSPEHLSD
jgi:hypothetical protein